ncbi:MAG: serine--tRNA ligase [Thaumarchaeota archaeon]|nr:serine--tRNA ligase [Nitrososphaerota archaeon]
MLDVKLVREKPDAVREMLRLRKVSFHLDELLDLDVKRRNLITEAQQLKTRRNRVSEEIASLRKQGKDNASQIEEMRQIGDRINQIDGETKTVENCFQELMSALPNFIDTSVPIGEGEQDNVELRKWGEPRAFDFEVKDHIALGEKLDLIDVERAGKVAGARFYYLKGDLVKLNYALVNFALDFIRSKGYILIQPPYMLRREAIAGAVMFSDFEDVIYKVEGEDLYLIGTAEHAIAAMHMDEVFSASALPLRYAGVSPCFRKEAGAHGRDTKGIFRVHQFEKVEQFIFCKPEESWKEHESLLKNAEEFFQALGLPHRVMLLCSADLGKISAKTYDLEVWLPGQGKYREAVSCSNCTDYQARRLRVKVRDKPHDEAKLTHTLNSTLVATERALIAIMENYQQRDGSIDVPSVLQPYIGDIKTIRGEGKHTA